MKIAYYCVVEKQEDGKFFVTFPDFEEGFTEGDSLAEALFNAEEVLTLTLDSRIDERMDIPAPIDDTFSSDDLSTYLVYPSPRIQSALLVRFIRSNRSMAELARFLETSWPAASRLEDPHHWSNLRQLSKVAKVYGSRLVISFESLDDNKRASA